MDTLRALDHGYTTGKMRASNFFLTQSYRSGMVGHFRNPQPFQRQIILAQDLQNCFREELFGPPCLAPPSACCSVRHMFANGVLWPGIRSSVNSNYFSIVSSGQSLIAIAWYMFYGTCYICVMMPLPTNYCSYSPTRSNTPALKVRHV